MVTPCTATESVKGLSEPLRSLPSVCDELGITPTIAYGLLKQGLPHVKLNRRVIRFNMTEVRSWVESRRVGTV